ncbi:MAG: peptidoglycan DD-metalloendopeptidase family protein [Myxococcaceae bacterium]|nr:peptidoglycan DD-metalloendopeptidase family protein [Myxococcaceae bacterium]
MRRLIFFMFLCACGVEGEISDPGLMEEEDTSSTGQAVTCNPRMNRFPVGDSHNIGYDSASCGTGTCRISCPDQNANSDWNGAAGHHGIDVFAYHRAPLVAAADGRVVAVGTVSSTSGLRVRIRDACGWEYYYGHMDQAVVSVGQNVSSGQLIGYMGKTGAASTHLHFNVSPDGRYSSDINPFNLLKATSPTACAAPPVNPDPPVTPPTGCGILGSGAQLGVNQSVTSCDGRFTLAMQGDGNLVLYQANVGAIWASWTNGSGANVAAMQGDGNFVLYRNGTPVWHTSTHGRPGAYLAVQGDGNVVIYQGSTPRWSTGTCCR